MTGKVIELKADDIAVVDVTEALMNSGWFSSKSALRRAISQGAIHCLSTQRNDNTEDRTPCWCTITWDNRWVYNGDVIRYGSKHWLRIRIDTDAVVVLENLSETVEESIWKIGLRKAMYADIRVLLCQAWAL